MRSHFEKEVARLAANRLDELAQLVILRMCSLRDTHRLSGNDSHYLNVWLEFVAQVQGERSIYWLAYEKVVDDLCDAATTDLDSLETWVLWLASDAFPKWEENSLPDESIARAQIAADIWTRVEMTAGDFEAKD